MFCKNCGQQINKEGKFCGHCGTETKTGYKDFSTKTKNCAFCKAEIDFDSKECPNCKRMLVEKISSSQKYDSHAPEFHSPAKENIIIKSIGRIKNINYPKLILNKYVAILVGVIFFVWIFSGDDGSYNNSGTKIPLPAPVQQVSENSGGSNLDLSAFDVSLNTGTVLKRNNTYLSGYGELEIKNGTDLDAVAKLIRGGTSIFTVYIKANSTYIIKDISDGMYWLAFAQGSNWDSTTQKFRRNIQYSAFDETFDFSTTNTQYTIFEVTLNPVIGGTAETSSVDPAQFNAY